MIGPSGDTHLVLVEHMPFGSLKGSSLSLGLVTKIETLSLTQQSWTNSQVHNIQFSVWYKCMKWIIGVQMTKNALVINMI